MDWNNEYFKKHKYLPVKGLLTPDECQICVEKALELSNKKMTYNDTQCPEAETLPPIYDDLLYKLHPVFEKSTGLRLTPTYSFSRLYRTGNDLRIHSDRKECEISVTITLGFEGTSEWPIYFLKDEDTKIYEKEFGTIPISFFESIGHKFVIPVGDGVMYRGTELAHWRKPLQDCLWHLQVFLHYFDTDGPLINKGE